MQNNAEQLSIICSEALAELPYGIIMLMTFRPLASTFYHSLVDKKLSLISHGGKQEMYLWLLHAPFGSHYVFVLSGVGARGAG